MSPFIPGEYCCFLFFFIASARAQTLSMPTGIPLTTATVSAAASYDATKDMFSYTYSLANSTESVGEINSFYMDISTTPNGAALGSGGLQNTATRYYPVATVLVTKVENATIPVGFNSAPSGWTSGPTAQFTAGWFGPPDILPGKSLGVFILTSHGLPGIRRFVVKPAYDASDFLPGIDDDSGEAQQIVDLDNEIQRMIQTRGYTIGPVQPPSLTDVGRLLDFVASLKHQAAALGWISGPGVEGVVQSLDAKLSAAKAALARGDAKAAEGQITAFIDELEAQRGKHLNDDAFYMLQANAQFILAKLGP